MLQRHKPWLMLAVVSLIVGLVGAACAGAPAEQAPPTQAEMSDDSMAEEMPDEPVDDEMSGDAMSDEMAEDSMDDETVSATVEGPGEAVSALLPAAPAAPGSGFRYDHPEVVAATGRPQLVEFFTGWCSTCNAIKDGVHELEAEYWGTVDFVYLDREAPANADVVEQFGISYQPVFVLLDPSGSEVARWFAFDEADLRAELDSTVESAQLE